MARRAKIELPARTTGSTSAFLNLVIDRYGENIIAKNEEILNRELRVIPTGSISLDVSIGRGGIPRGKYTEIYGPESSAKTSLCLSIAKQALAQGLRVLYVEPENSLDYNYIEAIVGSIDTENFILAQPETAEQTLSICEAGVRSKEFGLIVVDSVGSLATKSEQEDDLEKGHFSGISKLLTLFMKRNAFAIRDNDIAFIFINQVRDNVGNPDGGVSTPGGHALKHFTALRIQLNRQDTIEVTIDKDHKEQLGINARYTIKKNKIAKPFRSFFFPFIFGKGIDYVQDVVNFAEMLRILDKRGSYYVYEGKTIAQGLANTVSTLESSHELLAEITKRVYNSIQDKELPVAELEDDDEGENDGTVTES